MLHAERGTIPHLAGHQILDDLAVNDDVLTEHCLPELSGRQWDRSPGTRHGQHNRLGHLTEDAVSARPDTEPAWPVAFQLRHQQSHDLLEALNALLIGIVHRRMVQREVLAHRLPGVALRPELDANERAVFI